MANIWLSLDFIQLPPLHTRKALFKALIGACKRFSIKDYILSITTDNYVVNNGMVDQFEKHVVKSVEKRYLHEPLLVIFKVDDGYIHYMAHLINILAQAILVSLKSIAKEHICDLHDNTWFSSRASCASVMGKTRRIIIRYH